MGHPLALLLRRVVWWGVGSARAAVERAAIGECDAACVEEVRAVAGTVAIHDDRVAELQIAFFPTAAREREGTGSLAGPVHHVSFIVGNIKIEIGVRIRPLDAGDFSLEAHRFATVEFGGEGMVRSGGLA